MASNERFTTIQTTNDGMVRSTWEMNNRYKADIFHGDLVPIEITRVMPNDSFECSVDGFIRTATPPIAPFMDSIWANIAYFYVPERLVWNKEKEFMGENTEGYGIQTEIYRPRSTSSMTISSSELLNYPHSIGKYLGLVRNGSNPVVTPTPISLNEIRSFLQVYNDWFRNENFMDPYLWDHNQTGDGSRLIASRGGVAKSAISDLPKVCKKLDLFTSCLPWTQKGDPVLLPLGDSAPIVDGDVDITDDGHALSFFEVGDSDNTFAIRTVNDGREDQYGDLQWYADDVQRLPGDGGRAGYLGGLSGQLSEDAYVDLSQAVGATVNQFRFAFATQRYLEALARGGSKYRETIKSLFGVSIGDTTAQMAEYLGGTTIDINIDQVTQTTGYSAGQSTTLGAPGAVSLSAWSDHVYTKSFSEPGFVIGVLYTKHQRTYGQGVDETFFKHDILEEYNPKFAFIGEQPVRDSSIYFTGESAKDSGTFGFQEAWYEYRYKRDVVVGLLNPAYSNALNFWSLADDFTEKPTLGADFLTEDRKAIARCLSGGEVSPDYFVDLIIRRRVARPMPIRSTPGYIDHF